MAVFCFANNSDWIGVNYLSHIVNETEVQFDQPPILENGRTLVPVRAISEAFDCKVDWIQDTQTVVIAPPE